MSPPAVVIPAAHTSTDGVPNASAAAPTIISTSVRTETSTATPMAARPSISDRGRSLFGALARYVTDDDAGALVGHRRGNRLADASGGACHDRDFSG